MVVSAGPWSSEKAEMNILEINEKLRPQLAENKQQFRNLKEKFLVTQVAYFLANLQNKYKYEECKDLIKSMLRDELQVKGEKLAEQLKEAEELRQHKVLVHSQAQELIQLRERLREGRDASRSLTQHLQALLTPDEPDKSQRQDLREQLAEGCRLARHLVQKLSLENDEDENDKAEEVDKVQESPVPRNTKITFEEDKATSTLIVDGESSQDEWQDALNILPENQNDHEEEEGKAPVSPRKLQESEEKEVLQDSPEESVLTSCSHHDMSQSYQSCEGTFLALDEQKVCSAQDVASERSNSKGEETPLGFPEKQLGLEEVKRQETIAPRLSREPLRVDKHEVPRELLDGCYLIASVLPDLTHSCQPYRRTLYSFEEKQVSLALVDKNLNDRKKMEDQQLLCPRLNRQLLQVEEHEVPQESWDEADSTLPIPPELTGSYQSDMRSALHSLEEQQACVALDVDKINKDQEELVDQDPPCRRLRQEVPENSLDEVYLTPSVPHDLCDCHQAYSGTLYSLEDQLACSALDIACEYSSLKVTKLHCSPRQPLSVLLCATCAAPTQAACPHGPWSGDINHHLSEVQASQAQPELRTLVPNCLQLQLDQGFDCGYGLARQGVSSTTCSFTANADPGKQWPFQELGSEPSLGMKNPPQLEGDALEGSTDNTHGHQVIGHIHASSVLKPKMIKRKLPFSKWRLACRFPGLQA
ncbi:PREDICTED: neuroblastoma breakpoint family member 4-like isoform X2 [Rhinopithecus bieti]|uniref:neuroblastoma breakpoint family member 4-like isoform X2 n=1 Tax=Rhinopithecus bieti TaxID=61621 RepID=UPI00083C7EF1|nr:PREDICTED: neuroblastoma breakpoint family member 4-like isoform X2 [Rhinopithecus bieti]